MLPTLSAAAARAALRRFALHPIQRRWMLLRQISTVEIPLAPHPAASNLSFFRTYARMARRIPAVRSDNYSDSEPDKEEHEEEGIDAAEERGDEPAEWEGVMIDLGSESDEDSNPAEDEEDNK